MKTIAYITDTHLGETGPGEYGADERHNWQTVLADLSTRQIDKVIFGGDIGLFSEYPGFFESLKDYDLMVTPGNHDTSAHVRQFFPQRTHLSEFYGAQEDKDFKWIFLDSSTDKISPAQIEWLRQQLIPGKPILLFVHHPILPVDTPVDRKYPLENRDEIKSLLLGHPEKVTLFCGHYHIEDAMSEANITQYVTPAVSYQIKKGTPEVEGDATYFGYRMIYLDGARIETETIILYPDEF